MLKCFAVSSCAGVNIDQKTDGKYSKITIKESTKFGSNCWIERCKKIAMRKIGRMKNENYPGTKKYVEALKFDAERSRSDEIKE